MMRTRLALSVATAAAMALLVATAPASAASTGRRDTQPSTRGVIVWTHRVDDGSEPLLIARADGSQQRALTPSAPDTVDKDAQISPGGGWVAYEHDSPGSETIHLVKPNGAGDHVLGLPCADPCFGSDGPTWLSDRRIAFLRVVGPFDPVTGNAVSAVLFSVGVDGTGLRRLSEPGIDGVYEDRYARVSRDRSYVTFQRLRLADGRAALFRMAPDGSHVRQLTPWDLNVDLYDLSTARSGPTKDLIAFQSVGRGDPDASFIDIGFLPATCPSVDDCTSKIVWMTDNSAIGRRNSSPQWSPDGSSLVFIDRPSIDDPNAEIWTTRFGGTEEQRRNISNSVNFDYRPAWGR
jgi:Tol biopolymer transport system component